MKRTITALSLALASALLYADAAWVDALLEASAQGRRPARVDYSKFKHSSHAGAVKTPAGSTQQLDCAYCHTFTKEQPNITVYPNTKPGLEKTHSACADCHAFAGSQMKREMCAICHSALTLKPEQMAKNLRPFPNPAVIESQFGDLYSHKSHNDYFDKFECAKCHQVNKETVTIASLQFKAGAAESLPSHPECFTCHYDEKVVSKKDKTFATNCVGCHAEPKAGGKASAPAVHWFVRQIVTTAKLPFSHKTHEDQVSKGTKGCLECHPTGKTATKRADFFLDPRTKQKQPPASSCVECHKKEMQQRIENKAQLGAAKCLYCHAPQTIKDRPVSELPPASHLGKKPAATPALTPTPKPEVKPESPAPKPALSNQR